MTTPVAFSPPNLDFGGVRPGSLGPDISVDPSLPSGAISFQGGIQISNAPADANVTANIVGDTVHFMVRDITVLEWIMEPVDCDELPPGFCKHHPPPKHKVLEQVAQSNGSTPLAIKKGQFLLVRVAYAALSDEGTFRGTLVIQGDTWNTIQIPLSLFLAQVTTSFVSPPLLIHQGQQAVIQILVRSVAGPEADVKYEMSPLKLHTGISLSPTIIHLNIKESKFVTLTFQADQNAPLGENTLFVNQFAFGVMGLILPVIITPIPQSELLERAAQKIREKYVQIGESSSKLGLPMTPNMDVQFNGTTYFTNFRGGRIDVTDPMDNTPAKVTQEIEIHVDWVALECQIRQESTDELYGTIGIIAPGIQLMGKAAHDSFKFPDDGDGTWDLGPDGLRIVQTSVRVYSGPPEDLFIPCQLIEHDSGDAKGAKQVIKDMIDAGAAGLGGVDGFAAEKLASGGKMDELKDTLSSGIISFLGADDDKYNPGVLTLYMLDLREGNFQEKVLSRSDDPRHVPYTHSLVVSGRDQGGDIGQYAFYFEVTRLLVQRPQP